MYNIDEMQKRMETLVADGSLTAECANTIMECAQRKNELEEAEIKEAAGDETPSTIDLVNQFIAERVQEKLAEEACAECDPAKNVENEITEKLPTVNPNEPNEIGSMKEVEKTDKAIEDAKKDLDPAAKIAELKAKHEAEKDSTEQHEVIDHTTKLENAEELSAEDRVNISKLNVYEACDAEIITAEEKEALLELLDAELLK